MLDDRSDLTGLRNGVEKITEQWFEHRGPWLGISDEKLSQTKLPDPLRWIYKFAGEWPSNNWWETVYAYQDMLLPFESLAVKDGKLVSRSISFHLVDGRFLVMDNGWCGTPVDEPWELFPGLFKVPDEPARRVQGHLPFPEDIEIPDFVRKSHIQNLIRRHQRQADYHQEMISKYEKMVKKMDGQGLV